MPTAPDGATPLDPDEINGLRMRHVTSRQQLDDLESANIAEGLRWLRRRRGGDILSSDFVRKLHIRLFGDVWSWAGSFRLTEKNIGIDPYTIPVQLKMHLDNARYWAGNDIFSPREAAARFHHGMVQIHPFANGNGRHARIATDIFLADYYQHPAIEWASGVDLQADGVRRTTYIAALRAADAGEFDRLLTFFGI
jgi:Fic-DOC domain mobile mystery protein B